MAKSSSSLQKLYPPPSSAAPRLLLRGAALFCERVPSEKLHASRLRSSPRHVLRQHPRRIAASGQPSPNPSTFQAERLPQLRKRLRMPRALSSTMATTALPEAKAAATPQASPRVRTHHSPPDGTDRLPDIPAHPRRFAIEKLRKRLSFSMSGKNSRPPQAAPVRSFPLTRSRGFSPQHAPCGPHFNFEPT